MSAVGTLQLVPAHTGVQMRRKIVRGCLIGLLALVMVTSAVLVYLVSTGFGAARGLAARLASQAVGRPVVIKGPFHVRLGSVIRIEAGSIVIANTGWGSGSSLASAGRLDVSIETRSLLHGPLHIERIAVREGRVNLETDRRGRNNWTLGSAGPSRTQAPALPRIDAIELQDCSVRYAAASRPQPLEVALRTARLRLSARNMVRLSLDGSVDGRPASLNGEAGPVAHLTGGRSFHEDLTFKLGDVSGTLRGRVASLSTLEGASLDLSIGGPDIAELATIAGHSGWGHGPFRVMATARPAGSAIEATFDATSPVIHAQGHGTIIPGAPPRVDLTFDASGSNLHTLGMLTGLDTLPAKTFAAGGRLQWHGFPLIMDHVHIETGAASIKLDGSLGRPPRLAGTKLRLDARRVPVSWIRRFANIALPAGMLSARGGIEVRGQTIRIVKLHAADGPTAVRGSGMIVLGSRSARFDGSVSGPDLAVFSGIAGTKLPSGPFAVTSRLAVQAGTVRLASLAGRFGDLHLSASGVIVASNGGAGTTLQVRCAGRDFRMIRRLTGYGRLPRGPFEMTGHCAVRAAAIDVKGLDIHWSGGRVTGEVRVAKPPASGPVVLHIHATGPDLGAVAPLAGLSSLPGGAYDVAGRVTVSGPVVQLEGARVHAGGMSLAADGTIGLGPHLAGTALQLTASGEDLARLGTVFGHGGLPALPFAVSGGVSIASDSITVREATMKLGSVQIGATGTMSLPGFRFSINVDASGTNPTVLVRCARAFGAGSTLKLPARPFAIRGTIGRDAAGFDVSGLHLKLGALRGEISGRFGLPPRFATTDIHVNLSGGNVTNLAELTGRRLDVQGLSFVGLIRAPERQRAGGPVLRFSGRLSAKTLALGTSPHAKSAKEKRTHRKTSERLFSTKPLAFKLPTTFAGRFECRIGHLKLPSVQLNGVDVVAVLDRDGLRLTPVQAQLEGGGALTGVATMSTSDGRVNIAARLRLDHSRLGLVFGTPPQPDEPPLDIRIDLAGTGRSPHELAASLRGRFSMMAGNGRLASSVLDTIGDSLLLKILDTINPFARRDPTTELSCAAVAGVITNGQIVLGPAGLTTSKVVTVGTGTVDLGSEKVDITFTTKSRRGLGISAGTLANAYLRIGGTLTHPAIKLKPLSAATSTGLAVATGGLSWLARGLFNRIQAGKDTCGAMSQKIRDLWAQPAAGRVAKAP